MKAKPSHAMASTSRAITALLEIMRDTEQAPRPRIEACEHLLDYECPAEVIDEAKAALLAIVEADETSTDTKLTALKLLRRCEAKRVSPGRSTSDGDAKIQLAVELVRRRSALLRAGVVSRPDNYAADIFAAYPGVPSPDGTGLAAVAAPVRKAARKTSR